MSDVWKRLNKSKLGSFRQQRPDPLVGKNGAGESRKRTGLPQMLSSLHQRWLNTSLRKKGWAVVMLPTIALLVSFVGLVTVVFTSQSALDGVQSSLQAQSSAQSVLTLTLDAETGVRGYLVTNSSSYLSSFQTAQKNLPATFATLSSKLSGDKASSSLISQLKKAVDSDMSLLTTLQNLGPGQGSQQASLLTQEHQEIDKVRSIVNSLDSRISALVSSKEATAHDMADVGLWAAIIALVLGITGGVAATQLFTSGISTRIRSLRRSAERLSKGEPPERLTPATDEVGKLAAALFQASNLLEARELALREESVFFEHLVSASPVVKFQSTNGLPGNGFVSENLDRVFSISSRLVAVDADHWLNAINREDKETVTSQARNAILNRSPQLISTYRVLGNDGVQRWVYSTVKLSYDNEDGPVSALGVLIDITESREATRALGEREEMLRGLFDASPDAVMVLDKSGRIKMASGAFTRLTGEPLTRPDAQSFFHYLDPRELIETEEQMGRSLSGTDASFIRRMRLRSSKGWRVVEGHGVALDFRTREKDLLLVLRDVTEQVDLEEKLKRATEAAEAANRAKNEFLSRMSHELRTPLNAILGFAQLLELDKLSQEQQDSLDQIRHGGEHLLQLINEVLDIARIETGNMAISKEKIRISEVVTEVCDLLRPLAIVSGIDVSPVFEDKKDEMVVADRQRVRQILMNLISNAIKYNRQGGSVTISCEVDKENNVATLSVADTGPGISPEQIDLVFKPFERLGAETSDIEGTGIGLTLSRELAEAMESSLTLESSSSGTTFYLRMPYAGKSDGSDLAVTSAVPETLRVLYIEDDPSNIRLIERAAARAGNVELTVANTGRRGQDLALRNPPNLILLDLHLPDLKGEEVLTKFRSDSATREVPVVVMSADATESHIKELLDGGATDYLTKPIDLERLFEIFERIRTVGSILRSHHLT